MCPRTSSSRKSRHPRDEDNAKGTTSHPSVPLAPCRVTGILDDDERQGCAHLVRDETEQVGVDELELRWNYQPSNGCVFVNGLGNMGVFGLRDVWHSLCCGIQCETDNL